jgi:tetratricopeptide (TPR) repeat protein
VTWRSITGIVLTVLVLSACYFIGVENRELLSQTIQFWTKDGRVYGLPVDQTLLGCLALGAGVVALAWALRSTRAAVQRSEGRRRERSRRVLDEHLIAGHEEAGAGRPATALPHFEAVLEKEPAEPGALAGAADALRQLGRPSEALELRERLLGVRPGDNAVQAALALDHRARGDLGLAAAALEHLLGRKPADAAAVARDLVDLRLELGDFAAALAAHDRWSKLAGSGPGSARERAAIETRQAALDAHEGRVREAVATLKRVIKKHPDYSPASLMLARAQLLEGDEQAALNTWLAGYEATREGAFLVAAEEHFLGADAEGEDAIERASSVLNAMKRFAACSGDRPQAVAFLGKLQTRFEMLDDAAASFDGVRESFPDNPTFTYYAARIAEKRGDHETAAGWYRGILKALDILRPTYRCRSCEAETEAYADRCGSCGEWGSVSLDIGVKPLLRALPAAHPVYSVRGDETETESEAGQEAVDGELDD